MRIFTHLVIGIYMLQSIKSEEEEKGLYLIENSLHYTLAQSKKDDLIAISLDFLNDPDLLSHSQDNNVEEVRLMIRKVTTEDKVRNLIRICDFKGQKCVQRESDDDDATLLRFTDAKPGLLFNMEQSEDEKDWNWIKFIAEENEYLCLKVDKLSDGKLGLRGVLREQNDHRCKFSLINV